MAAGRWLTTGIVVDVCKVLNQAAAGEFRLTPDPRYAVGQSLRGLREETQIIWANLPTIERLNS